MGRLPRLYLAGPDIFRPEAQAIAARQRALCVQFGFQPLHPLDADQPVHDAPQATAMAIYRTNTRLLDSADAIVANLTPFRGPSADPGTVFELGWMVGRGKPAFGYSLSRDLFLARTIAARPGATITDGRWRDADGADIEDFGLHENLMIDAALREAGTPMIFPPSEAAVFDCFEACLRAARARFDAVATGR